PRQARLERAAVKLIEAEFHPGKRKDDAQKGTRKVRYGSRLGGLLYDVVSMSTLKKNVGVFDADVAGNEGYKDTTSPPYSSIVANRRMTDATLQRLVPTAKRILDAGCGDGTYANEIKQRRSSLEIVGFDPAGEAIRVARNRYPDIEFAVGDILRPETFP